MLIPLPRMVRELGVTGGKIVSDGKAEAGWFDLSTLKEPYRIEGKKTMGLELAEQLGRELPEVIFYPTGGGTGLIGIWEVFAEFEASGCVPIVKAYEEGTRHAAL